MRGGKPGLGSSILGTRTLRQSPSVPTNTHVSPGGALPRHSSRADASTTSMIRLTAPTAAAGPPAVTIPGDPVNLFDQVTDVVAGWAHNIALKQTNRVRGAHYTGHSATERSRDHPAPVQVALRSAQPGTSARHHGSGRWVRPLARTAV